VLTGRSLLDEYRSVCAESSIKPNSGLLKTLPAAVGDFATTINLDLNYIGVKGLQPLLQILRHNRGLKLLNLKDNNLENNEVRQLVQVLMTEVGDSLQHLDLSNNPISLAGGSALMDLVSSKKALTTIVLRGTLIQPKVVEKIAEAAENNRRRSAWSSGLEK
jgi:Ran GTPase-activating protein (RanGAP) involved in mRNA processing and transport